MDYGQQAFRRHAIIQQSKRQGQGGKRGKIQNSSAEVGMDFCPYAGICCSSQAFLLLVQLRAGLCLFWDRGQYLLNIDLNVNGGYIST